MKTSYQNIFESQQEMLDQWLDFNKTMFKTFWNMSQKETTSAKKKKTEELTNLTATPWLEAMQKMMEMNSKVASGIDFPKVWEESAKVWSDWINNAHNFLPFQEKKNSPMAWLQEGYAAWAETWMPMDRINLSGFKNPFLQDNWRKSIFGMMESYPADQFCSMLSQYNQQLERYIEVVENIDLPIDEMAAFWEKMLEHFTPQENAPYSILSQGMSDYVEFMTFPGLGLIDFPQTIAQFKLWYTLQFHYLNYLIRNLEMRGMVLEASLAAWPEALKECTVHYENNGDAPSLMDFSNHLVNKLESQLQDLMKSDDYILVQEKIVETMVILKSHMNKVFELWAAEMPLVTQADLSDIAKEIEALRIKIRQMGELSKPVQIPVKKRKKSEMN